MSLTPDAPVPAAPPNGLGKDSAHLSLDIDGATFELKVDYWTTVAATTWDVTGAKNVHLLAYVLPSATGKAPDVVIDRFIQSFTLMAGSSDATAGGTNGLPGGPHHQDGVPRVAVRRRRDQRRAGPAVAAVGSWAGADRGGTASAGVYAVRASMMYRLLVRNAGDPGWHRRTMVDTLTVAVKAGS